MRTLSTSIGLLLAFTHCLHAQWLTQSLDLKAGWNAVFLHVDASHTTLDSLVGNDPSNPILEVWQWQPGSTAQFIETPLEPNNLGSEWFSWVRGQAGAEFQNLVGDSAYLVKVGATVGSYTWHIKGHPVAPRHQWRIDGLNLIGFSTAPNSPPNFAPFLEKSTDLQELNTELFQYVGGDIGPNNPVPVEGPLLNTTPVRRGEAYWIRNGEVFNRYFGPFEVILPNPEGVNFRDNLGSQGFRLRNLSPDPLTISLELVQSELPVPSEQTPITGIPPLLIRGQLNTADFTYGHTSLPLAGTRTWTLNRRNQEGSEVQVVLGLDRSAIQGEPGDLLAGVLRFTDSLGYSQVDVSVSAEVSSPAGLWMGSASVTQVGQYLKSFARDGEDKPVLNADGRYQVNNVNTNMAGVASPAPLRLIVHNPDAGQARLLQRVYFGFDSAKKYVVSNSETSLDPTRFADARRLSASHLPWSETNPGWPFDARMVQGAILKARVTTATGDQGANPFLHTYHPDHDNLDALFQKELARGVESYSIVRDITLSVLPPADDFEARTSSGLSFFGEYQETIQLLGRGTDARRYDVRGFFNLQRINDLPDLTLVQP